MASGVQNYLIINIRLKKSDTLFNFHKLDISDHIFDFKLDIVFGSRSRHL